MLCSNKPSFPTTYHITRPAMTAAQVTQQVSGLLVSSSISLQQQHRHTRYIARTSRLRPRPTAPTQARNIRDWGRVVVGEKRQNAKQTKKTVIFKSFPMWNQQISLKRQLLCVVLKCQTGEPPSYTQNTHLKGWQHWVKTSHQYQTTLVSRYWQLSIDQHNNCCLQAKETDTGEFVVLCEEEPTEILDFFHYSWSQAVKNSYDPGCERGRRGHHVMKGLSFSLVISECTKYLKPEGWRGSSDIK